MGRVTKSHYIGPMIGQATEAPIRDDLAIMKTVAYSCAMCGILAGGLSAQPSGVPEGLERGRTGIGSHVNVFFGSNSVFRSGLEVGFSKTGRIEQEFSLGATTTGLGRETHTSSTRLWHASVVARREWPTLGQRARVYAVGGTGLYLGRTATRVLHYDALTGNVTEGGTSHQRDWEFGANVGAGVEFQRVGLPGALGLDARFHLLPFSSTAGPRTLFTISAGLSFF